MIIDGIEFKKYDDFYYVSASGDIYSVYKKGLLKHSIDKDGYHRVDIHQKHIKIHKLVYITWIGNIDGGLQINHKDDNKNNNHFSNLYLGTQKQNIHDCINNDHRVGHKKRIIVFDKIVNEKVSFDSIKEFLSYAGHPLKSGSINKAKDKKWFKSRFVLLEEV